MAITRRYTSLDTFEDDNGNTYSRRYKGVSKSQTYTQITVSSPTTFDLLSLQYYGSPLMYWLIADFNGYLDPTVTIPAGTILKVPQV